MCRIGETSTEVAGGIDYHPDAELPVPITGDVNLDGEVTVSDINAVVDVIFQGGYVAAADVNRDGEVNVSDINAVVDLIVR